MAVKLLVLVALIAVASCEATEKPQSKKIPVHFHDDDSDSQSDFEVEPKKTTGGWWFDKSKWDGYVFGAPTYKMGHKEMVEALTPKDGKWSADEFMTTFSERNHYTEEVHVVDWWKMSFFSKFNRRHTGKMEDDGSLEKGQVFWPQTVRDKCMTCRLLIAPEKQVGMFNRIVPDIVDGGPNLYNSQYLESYQILWTLKRCPIYNADACYRPDGFGMKLMQPCPDGLICSSCLGIPPSYCADFF